MRSPFPRARAQRRPRSTPHTPPPRIPERAAAWPDCLSGRRRTRASLRADGRTEKLLAGRALARLAYRDRPPAERLPVERTHGGLGLRVAGELDEGEASRTARFTVGDDLDLRDLAPAFLEKGPQLRLAGLVRNVPDVQSLPHSS